MLVLQGNTDCYTTHICWRMFITRKQFVNNENTDESVQIISSLGSSI